MNPILAAGITGGASLLGSMFSSQTSADNVQQQIAAQEQMQNQTEQFNAGQAQINRDYETQMSNTAYQRASQDMQKAGLNPMMMFGSGGAASSPGGAQASVGTPSVPVSQSRGALGGLGEAVTTGVNSAIAAKTIDKMQDEMAVLLARKGVETATEGAIKQQTDESASRTGMNRQTIALRGPAEQEAQGAEGLGSKWLQNIGKIKYLAGAGSDVLAPIVSSATGVGRVLQGFQDLSRGSLQSKIDKGNFIGKYGVPVDEYIQ